MRIYITDKDEIRTIELKTWDKNRNDGWSPDCFGDVADTMPTDYPISDGNRNTAATCEMTDEEYRETVKWWESEVAAYNCHNPNSWFVEGCDDVEAEFAKNLEYGLFAD